MPAPLSPDIRNRFQVLHREGLSAREIGRRLLISAAVIPPFLMGLSRRIHAAVFSFMAGVIPPIAMLGRSLLYVQSHFVA